MEPFKLRRDGTQTGTSLSVEPLIDRFGGGLRKNGRHGPHPKARWPEVFMLSKIDSGGLLDRNVDPAVHGLRQIF